MLIVFIHGFLGQSHDWDAVAAQVQKSINPQAQILRLDLFTPASSAPATLPELGDWVNVQVRDQAATGPRVIVGYSLGGRIALHAVTRAPELWDGAVIIGAHPGLSSEENGSTERDARLRSDREWAQRFRSDDWNSVLSSWNEQLIFKAGLRTGPDLPATPHPIRVESQFSRKSLGDIMEGCSPGVQKDLRPALSKLEFPVLWIAGERDAKFCAVNEEMVRLNLRFKRLVVPHAGHRVLWEQPEAISGAIAQTLY